MTAKELLANGKVQEAESVLTAALRSNPTDVQKRTILFEILCFSGQYERAGKHLGLLAQGSKEAETGAVLLFSALHAEKLRHEMFRKQEFPSEQPAKSPSGKLNGKPFESISDADPEIGARLELYAAGAYLWLPFQHLASVNIDPPRTLRDTLWTPGFVLTGPSFNGTDIGQVIIPNIYPFSWKSDDETLWLGHGTEWVGDDGGNTYPVGQKTFMVDGEEVPLLEIRSLEFASDATS